jgi:phosphatidylserine/phosphatidylglycerophosphate/cardiolipin synthase-like enzyme
VKLDPGRNCWRIERAGRAALIVDAADYFHHARKAMLAAEQQILMIGWDFDTRIILDDADDEAPETLGSFISWMAEHRPQVSVQILRWDWGATKLLARGTTVFRLLNWARTRQIKFKLDGAHPTGASHHQKIVVAMLARVPPPEDRRHRRQAGVLRRHRHDRDALGHARASRRR